MHQQIACHCQNCRRDKTIPQRARQAVDSLLAIADPSFEKVEDFVALGEIGSGGAERIGVKLGFRFGFRFRVKLGRLYESRIGSVGSFRIRAAHVPVVTADTSYVSPRFCTQSCKRIKRTWWLRGAPFRDVSIGIVDRSPTPSSTYSPSRSARPVWFSKREGALLRLLRRNSSLRTLAQAICYCSHLFRTSGHHARKRELAPSSLNDSSRYNEASRRGTSRKTW